MGKIKMFLSSQYQQYSRVWRMLKKPSMAEFMMTAKVSAIGLALIGVIGFIINVFITLVFK